jgi:type IV secretion system protein VirD4
VSKDAAGNVVPGDMLIFTAGNPPIYGRQILYFIDPVFSARARVKAPGVTEGFSRGLSDSLYFSMPFSDGSNPPEAPTSPVKEPAKHSEGDLLDEYQKLLEV